MREIFLLSCNINNDANAANTTTCDKVNVNNNNNNNNSIEVIPFENLIPLTLVKKFLEFTENEVFIVVLTRTYFFSLPCARLIHSMAYYSTLFLPYNIIIIIIIIIIPKFHFKISM